MMSEDLESALNHNPNSDPKSDPNIDANSAEQSAQPSAPESAPTTALVLRNDQSVQPFDGLTVRASLRLSHSFGLDVDLQLPSSGITAILGPSGCGKTTLLRSIAGLTRPYTGRIALGQELWQEQGFWLPPHKRPIGFVFQQANLLRHLTVEGNLAFASKRTPRDRRRLELGHAIELLAIEPLLSRYPERLSGGEAARVAIARAIASSPLLLLMDEPLSALDPERKNALLPYFEHLSRDCHLPIIYVTHSVDEAARLSDFLVMLDQGQCLAQGTTSEVLSQIIVAQSQGENAGSVIEGIVQASDGEYGLMRVRYGDNFAGRLHCLQTHPQRAVGSMIRLHVLARDVSVTLEAAHNTSILNIVPATVQEISLDGHAQCLLRLDAFGTPLLSRITRKSAQTLDLKTGSRVFAQIKGVAVLDSSS